MEYESNDCVDVVIPRDAVEVKVTSMINPYYIRVFEVSENHTAMNNLTRKLESLEKELLKRKNPNRHIPAVGDNVIVSNKRMNDSTVDLPNWVCRGILTDTTTKTSDVFLIDYGIVVNVPTESLIKYSASQVAVSPLTITVGLYNIVPVDSQLCIEKDWSQSTLALIRQLFQVSKKIYFQILANDSKNNKYLGDFFLVIEDRNTCLSKILIRTLLAVPVGKELKQAVKSDTDDAKISVSYQMGLPKEGAKDSTKKTDSSLMEKKKYTTRKFLNKEKMLIQSDFSCKPLDHLSDARFTSIIHKALSNNGVKTPKQIQSYMWPAIQKGLNTVIVGTPNSGKTIGYLIPMLSALTEYEENNLEKRKDSLAAQPTVLIVASKCTAILYGYDSIKIFAAFNGLSDKVVLTNICNKFNILVSTPPFLLRTLEKYSNKLNFSELSCLILDQADQILEKYTKEVLTLVKQHKIIDQDRKNIFHAGKMQIITVSETWTDKLQSFIELFMEEPVKPFICIGSFVEAAAYSKVRGRMMICHSDRKMNELLNVLGDYSKTKTMVFCINSEEAIKLNNFLLAKSIKTQLVHEDMEILSIEAIREDWNKCLSGMYPVIICTDQVVFELGVSNIDYLIHYTVTNISKTSFNRRFSVFMDNWLQESKTANCKVLILFDETKENIHFKGVVSILKRLKVDLPSDWDVIADGLDLAADLKKKNYPICDSLKMFGWCKNSSCPYRHRVIAEADQPTFGISIGDELKLIIMATHSANHFTARLEETTKICEKTGSRTTVEHPFKIILKQKLKNYFANPNNRVLEKDIVVGKICAFRAVTYSRVQILNIVEHDPRTEKPKVVRIRDIDDGKLTARAFVYDLYELPDKEKLTERLPVIEVFLTNIAPFDGEIKWTDLATTESQNWYTTHCGTTSVYACAKVLLQIGNCVFTDTIVARAKQYGYKNAVQYSNLRDVLITNGHAEENKTHLESLVNLCISGGLTEINGKPVKLPEQKKSNPIDECD